MSLSALNRFCVYSDFVEATSQVRELKSCENCPNTFVRDMCRCRLRAIMKGVNIDYAEFKCGCAKFCASCVGRMLLPLDLQDYQATLPTANEQRHSHHLPHYDNSLLPKEHQRVYTRQIPSPTQKRKYRCYGDWKYRLRMEFKSKGQLSSQEIQDVIGVSGAPVNALRLCLSSKFPIRLLHRLKRTDGIRGRGLGVYELVETIQ